MNKENLLKYIAENAYDVGFGAKKHFATFDIVEKVPSILNIFTISIAILALVSDELSSKVISASLLIIGFIGLSINSYSNNIQIYNKKGKKITLIFEALKKLYLEVENHEDKVNYEEVLNKITDLEKQFHEEAISKQITFSNWYAHYKFFFEMQIDWLDNELHFSFFKDKVPVSFIFFIIVVFLGVLYYIH